MAPGNHMRVADPIGPPASVSRPSLTPTSPTSVTLSAPSAEARSVTWNEPWAVAATNDVVRTWFGDWPDNSLAAVVAWEATRPSPTKPATMPTTSELVTTRARLWAGGRRMTGR